MNASERADSSADRSMGASLDAAEASNAAPADLAAVLIHYEVNQLYLAYAAALDEKRFDDWPEFFLEDGHYKLQARENFERGLPLALMALESRGMMKDRVYGVTRTIYHGPYYMRHIVGSAQVFSYTDADIHAGASYAVFRTRPGGSGGTGGGVSEVYNVGRYIDTLVRVEGALKFKSRCAVYDSEMVLNSLIYPV